MDVKSRARALRNATFLVIGTEQKASSAEVDKTGRKQNQIAEI